MRGKIIALCIFGGIAFLALTTIVVDQIGAKRSSDALTTERDAAHRAGIPVFLRELAKPLPPASQNAAAIYEGMLTLHYDDPQNVAEGKLYVRLVKGPTTLSAADWQAVRKTIADESPRLRAIHDALSKPACVFHHDYQSAHPEDMPLPELSKIRNGARLLSMESLQMARDSKGVAAVANARLGFRLADDADSDPMLLGYLTAVAIDNITANTMQKILLLNPNSAATANAVLASLKDVHSRSLKPALGSESAFEQTVCETIRREGYAGVQKLTVSAEGGSIGAPMSQLLAAGVSMRRPVWNQIIDKNALALLRLNRATIAVCDQPYRESQPIFARAMTDLESQPVVTRATADLQSSPNPKPEDFLAAILVPVETNLPRTRATEANKIGVTQAAAAVLAYRAAHGGALPARLDQAMTNPPRNAFDDSPLAYQIQGSSFTVSAGDPTDPKNKSSLATFALK